jgi:hypothetical protein
MQNGINRRKLLRQAGAAAAVAAGALARPSAAFAQSSGFRYIGSASAPASVTNARVLQSFESRVAAAIREALVPVPPHTTNGDETRYPDKSGTYTKGLLQDGFGRVNLNASNTFKTALTSAKPSDFEKIILGGTLVHLRHRPESGGGLVHLIKRGQGNTIDARLNTNILNAQAVQNSFSKYGAYLLSQAFPEGSPTHPAYPTGHGTVAGACITLLKFFFDGNYVIPNPLVPTNDGLRSCLIPVPMPGKLPSMAS